MATRTRRVYSLLLSGRIEKAYSAASGESVVVPIGKFAAPHTAGPWRATFRGMDQGVNWASRIPYAIEREVGGAVQPIADICDQPQAEANANLMAAAPDLLAALRAAVESGLVPITSASEGGASRYSAQVAAADMIRAAITKATGAA